jgi:hypothetical protein
MITPIIVTTTLSMMNDNHFCSLQHKRYFTSESQHIF